MDQDLATLLDLVPDDVGPLVRKARDRTRAILQDALRSECRLVMRTPEETDKKLAGARVPVEVVQGYPVELETVKISLPPQIFPFLTRYRSALRNVHEGILKLEPLVNDPRLVEALPENVRQQAMKPTTVQGMLDMSEFCRECLGLLDRNDPIQQIFRVESDVLGVYEIVTRRSTPRDPHALAEHPRGDKEPNSARIRLFWAIIGLVAECRNWTVEDLTVVVLAHELAHAYTQLGAGIDGRRWPPAGFSESDVALKEGLAQYYTKRVLDRLPDSFKGASRVFAELLTMQPPQYRAHQQWEESNPEAVRSAMLQVRRKGSSSLETFNNCLGRAQAQLS